jgi:uncharacterized protein (TIGR03437 family)
MVRGLPSREGVRGQARMLHSDMRVLLVLVGAGALLAQQPILYYRGTVNAASLAPFGLPNAPIAQGSIFTIFGENLGPAQQQSATSFPLGTTLGGVSINVTQSGVTTQAYPIFVSAGQVNAVMPSSVAPGLATLRLFSQSVKSNAIPIQIASSAPGIFAVSSGGYGPGIVQNFISASNQPINSSVTPAAPGQTVVIWGTGLGPVPFPDNVAPTAGNLSTPVTVTVGGQAASVLYSGRSPCCSGVDQIVVTLPNNVPPGCWVPVTVNAGGVVSNTATMAIAPAGTASCSDPGNPLSNLVLTAGTQAFIHLEHVDDINNVDTSPATQQILDKFYSRFFTRPSSPYNFDPYMSFPPAGTCLVHQTSGDSVHGNSLRGALPSTASLSPQPKQRYNNGTQSLNMSPAGSDCSTALGGTIDSVVNGMNLLGANGTYTMDPGGANETSIPLAAETPPAWARPNEIVVIPRNQPLNLTFTPGDAASPTAILIYSYAAATNSTVEVECLAAAGASSFTISADSLANLPLTYAIADGSYTNLTIGSLGMNSAVVFHNGLAANGIVLVSSWLGQTVVIQ